MKRILIVVSVIFVYHLSFSQNLDLIVKIRGDSIACKIDSITESQIYFQLKTHGSKKWVQTLDDLDNISNFEYNVINEKMYLFKSGTTIIVQKKNLSGYRQLKAMYSTKDYIPHENDKYDPSSAGVLSLIPGLGLCAVGEPLKSFAYVGGMAGSLFLMGLGYSMAWGGDSGAGAVLLFGTAGFFGCYIASFISAVRVAKVKNMAIRDKAISFNFSPQIKMKDQFNTSNTFGLTVALSF